MRGLDLSFGNNGQSQGLKGVDKVKNNLKSTPFLMPNIDCPSSEEDDKSSKKRDKMSEENKNTLDGIINAVSKIADNVSAQISKLIGNITNSLSTEDGLPENVIVVEKNVLNKPDLLKLASDYLQPSADGIVMQIDQQNNIVWVTYAKGNALIDNNKVLKISSQKINDDIIALFNGNQTICLTK